MHLDDQVAVAGVRARAAAPHARGFRRRARGERGEAERDGERVRRRLAGTGPGPAHVTSSPVGAACSSIRRFRSPISPRIARTIAPIVDEAVAAGSRVLGSSGSRGRP